jgi:alcohol dehydrogenase (cytochrome c)
VTGRSLRSIFGLLAAFALAAFVVPVVLRAQVTSERLINSAAEPQNWLTYNGGYNGQRHSALKQITAANAKNLELKWVFQAQSLQTFEATPLVVDGIMYTTQAPNDVVALDAKTGRVFWMYRYTLPAEIRICCGQINRGLGMLGDTLFMGTIDAHLVAIDAKSGRPLWKTKVADNALGYALAVAPLVVKDKVIVGVAGGEYGIRGFMAAFDAKTGKEVWRFKIIPEPGEKGNETWPGTTWEHGGGSVWVTGAYDPALNLTYWGTGNPGPDWNPDVRKGDNLYTDSVIALDADTGQLKWHFQFTPNDGYDYDSVQVPILADANWNGQPRKLMYWANRNGFFYVLDRTDGKFLFGKPFVKLNWASGLDANGRPIPTRQPPGAETYPGLAGGTNWFSPSYNPRTGLFYVSVWENYRNVFSTNDQVYQPGRQYTGGRGANPIPHAPNIPTLRRGPINTWTEEQGTGAVIAIDPKTGNHEWRFPMNDVTDSGVLTTDSDVVITGSREGHFHVLDARAGNVLWKTSLGGPISSGPITYAVDGKQYIAVNAGNSMFVFALRE